MPRTSAYASTVNSGSDGPRRGTEPGARKPRHRAGTTASGATLPVSRTGYGYGDTVPTSQAEYLKLPFDCAADVRDGNRRVRGSPGTGEVCPRMGFDIRGE